jgi:hypothetical protein
MFQHHPVFQSGFFHSSFFTLEENRKSLVFLQGTDNFCVFEELVSGNNWFLIFLCPSEGMYNEGRYIWYVINIFYFR